jgi:hypothetical protein
MQMLLHANPAFAVASPPRAAASSRRSRASPPPARSAGTTRRVLAASPTATGDAVSAGASEVRLPLVSCFATKSRDCPPDVDVGPALQPNGVPALGTKSHGVLAISCVYILYFLDRLGLYYSRKKGSSLPFNGNNLNVSASLLIGDE